MPYRENTKPVEDIFPKTFFERHPKLKSLTSLMLDWLRGVAVVLAAIAAFPGLYYLGGWFGNSVMGWGLGDVVQGPQRWALGVAMVIFPVTPLWIGRMVKRMTW